MVMEFLWCITALHKPQQRQQQQQQQQQASVAFIDGF
jgi:preprotein translocase subunit YajC